MKVCFIVGDSSSPEIIQKILEENKDQLIVGVHNHDSNVHSVGVQWLVEDSEWDSMSKDEWDKLVKDSIDLNNMRCDKNENIHYNVYPFSNTDVALSIFKAATRNRDQHGLISYIPNA